jgi:hypothetical protein
LFDTDDLARLEELRLIGLIHGNLEGLEHGDSDRIHLVKSTVFGGELYPKLGFVFPSHGW